MGLTYVLYTPDMVPHTPVYLKLEKAENGAVDLVLCHENGEVSGYLLRLGTDGLLHRYTDLPSAAGFAMTAEGRIRAGLLRSQDEGE